MTGYYDIVLGLIPVALLGITAALTLVGISLTTAIPAGAFVSMMIIGHAMFVNTPADSSDDTQSPRPPLNAD
ncbi:hypothetical protein EA462_07965 [Natrarchaeobius halalkaliphilus]|uniref:Uncharacterized protein n=1 Tax=Natrarchaeobius halalkaliphilus TaxID=1679091 RepID=A0A3N6M8Y0_9EURY|nr:hypothetical protein [Natrarchaeobius halalkaliphilus]RQG89936.1 hypothetical protein EA462_07965 [Natrarchaeobius halalkaliphilus]